MAGPRRRGHSRRRQILYDAKTGTITNNKDANKYLKLDYRKGWEVKL